MKTLSCLTDLGEVPYMQFTTPDSDTFEYFSNPVTDARGGAGPQAVQFLVSKGVNAFIVPQLGPNAVTALRNSNVEAFQGTSISVRELISKWKNNELEKIW
ncbi:MAG: NifB/NifX family molybdenum-iron cluster-binding protein [Candidatus Heimdallarchaeota archaeon]|nr:NifB/NifX family molybdenum-iron cluster-binding protein [Candidatus Heimdallarchaeota archaeon]